VGALVALDVVVLSITRLL